MSENAEQIEQENENLQSQQGVDPNSLPENRPDPQDVIDTLIEELAQKDAELKFVKDERMFFKAQVKKFKRERDEALALAPPKESPLRSL